MEKIKRLVNFIIPVEACNFRCHYCYIEQEQRHTNKVEDLSCSLEHIQKAMGRERWGGTVHINMCAIGETLLAEYAPELAKRMLENGRFVSVVTNGTITKRIVEFCEFPQEFKQRLFFKFSYHYLELIKHNMMDIFFDNIRMVREADIAFTVELTVNDETIPYISKLKKLCEEKCGAAPHVIESRNNLDGYSRLTNLPVKEHQKAWQQFDSDLFNFQQTIWQEKRKEFCYAGDWVTALSVESGWLMPCFAGGQAIQNIYENIDEPIRFCAIGHNCPWTHCYAAYVLLTSGAIPTLNVKNTYASVRDRICADGSHWLTPTINEFFSSKFFESNQEYSQLKKSYVNQLMTIVYTNQYDGSHGEDEGINKNAVRTLLRKKKIKKVIICGTGKFRNFLVEILDDTKVNVLCTIDTQNTYYISQNIVKKILRKGKWFAAYHLPSFWGKKIYDGRIVKMGDFLPKVDTVLVTDFTNYNSIKKTIHLRAKRVLSITELCDDN